MSPKQGRTGPRGRRVSRPRGLPARITAERERRGLSQAAAAEGIGVALSTWASWEVGTHAPRGAIRRLLLAWLKK